MFKKLQDSEERFRNLSNNSPDIIYQLDQVGRIKFVNTAWKDLLGYPKVGAEGSICLIILNPAKEKYSWIS